MNILEKERTIKIHGKNYPVPIDVYEHNLRVEELAYKTARIIKLSHAECTKTRLGASYHDIGKILIPSEILYKEDPLTAEELERIQEHSTLSYRILKAKRVPEVICDIARLHHENYDGTGYPDGIKGEAIPIASRIIRICDSFDALTNDRVYQKSVSPKEAISRLQKCVRYFDPIIFKLFTIMILSNEEGEKRGII